MRDRREKLVVLPTISMNGRVWHEYWTFLALACMLDFIAFMTFLACHQAINSRLHIKDKTF